MPSADPVRRLRDIVENGRSILEDTERLSEASFIGDRVIRDAVLYRLLKISEAARKIGPQVDDIVSGIAWQQVRSFGNVIRHDYDAIRYDEVWTIIRRDLPLLVRACEEALHQLAGDARTRPDHAG